MKKTATARRAADDHAPHQTSSGALAQADGRGCKCGAVSPMENANCVRCGGRLADAPAKVPPTPRVRIVGFISQRAYERLNVIRSVNTWQISTALEFMLNEYWRAHKDELLSESPDADQEKRG